MALKITEPHFKVGDPGNDRFYIYADDYQGEENALTRGKMAFVLKPGTTIAQAEQLKNMMHDLIVTVTEEV
jgi:hypothetical protein